MNNWLKCERHENEMSAVIEYTLVCQWRHFLKKKKKLFYISVKFTTNIERAKPNVRHILFFIIKMMTMTMMMMMNNLKNLIGHSFLIN